jgi:hypothetical protein
MAKSGKYSSVSKFWTETVGNSLFNVSIDENDAYSCTIRVRDKEPPPEGQPTGEIERAIT